MTNVRMLAAVLRSVGTIMLVMGLPSGVLAAGLYRIEKYHFAILLMPAGFITIGACAIFRGRQLIAREMASVQAPPGRPTILYLRSFGVDTTPGRALVDAALDSLSNWRVITGLFEGWATEEERLADALEPVGHLVAVGKPGERLPLPGARRVYVGDEWRQAVTDMMSSARLTIIRMGLSPGVLWELERARQVLAPGRLLILLPESVSRKEYDSFRGRCMQILQAGLPAWEAVAAASKGATYGRSGYIYFMPGGSSRFVPMRAPRKHARGFKQHRQVLRYSFQPVYHALGVPWAPLKHVGGCLGLVIIIAIMFVATVAVITIAAIVTSGFRPR